MMLVGKKMEICKKAEAVLNIIGALYNYILYCSSYHLHLEFMQLYKYIIISSIDGETISKTVVLIPGIS